METQRTQRSQWETRIIQNLPLRRRCLFLFNENFLSVCFNPRDSAARARTASTAALLRPFMQVFMKSSPREDGLLRATQGMCECLTTVAAASPSRGSGAASSHVWAGWEEGLEVLLSFLEEPRAVSGRPSPVSHDGRIEANPQTNESGAVRAAPALAGVCTADTTHETDAEAAVRQLLCDLVRHLYDCGAAFYAAAKVKARGTTAAAATLKRRRKEETDSVTGVGGTAQRADGAADVPPMRVTWSIAAPVSMLLQELYQRE